MRRTALSQSNKNLLKIFSIVLLCVSLLSCQRNARIMQQEDTLDRIRRTGQIDACTVIDPPYAIKDAKTGKLSGVYIDALEIIAQKMNAKVVWHETTYGNAAADLASKRCDIMAQHFIANNPRATSIAFTMPPLCYLGFSAIVRANDKRFQNVKDIFEFDKPNLTIAVATGGAGSFFVDAHFKKAKINKIDVGSSDIARFCLEVSANRADVAIANTEVTSRYAKAHHEVRDLFWSRPANLEPAGWAVRQDDTAWLHFVETALQFLDTQGTVAQLRKKYGAHDVIEVKQYKLQ